MTPAGEAGLAALRADPGRAVVALDYDGTLAPIVDRPSEAVPAAGAIRALQSLSPQVGTLALVTGRPADIVVELGDLAAVPGLVVLGQYGLQRWTSAGLDSPTPLAGITAARRALPPLLTEECAQLEDKHLALVVHTRTCKDPAGALARLEPAVRELGDRLGLEVHPGRFVLEVRPPGFDKRGALLSLCEPPPAAVLFAGDDVGDLSAYDAVDELRAAGVPGLTICSDSAEAPPELRERADLVVDGPAGIVALLESLLPPSAPDASAPDASGPDAVIHGGDEADRPRRSTRKPPWIKEGG
ncbi:MAG: trehalose-phosphatase [Actinomycetota bacterium]|nr:trehalose-phosphatase [Actinomycetota bacterium]